MKKIRLKLTSLFLVLLFSVELASCGKENTSSSSTQSRGYKSSEEAIRAYFDAMKKQDLEGMVNTFAIEEYIENCDFAKRIERLGSYGGFMYIPPSLPNTNDYAKDINTGIFRSNIIRSIYIQYFYLADPELIIDPAYRIDIDEEMPASKLTSELASRLNSLALDTLTITDIDTPENYSVYYNEEVNQESIQSETKVAGAEKIENYIVFTTISDTPVAFCVETICYYGKWYMYTLGGNNAKVLIVAAAQAGTLYGVSKEDLEKNKRKENFDEKS